MFLQRAALLSTHSLRANTRHFSGMNHIRHSLKLVPALKTPVRTPIRLNFSRGERAFEKQLAINAKEPPRTGLLVKPLLFMVGVSGVTMVGAVAWEYENIRSQIKRMTTIRFSFSEQRQDSDLVRCLRAGQLKEAWSRLPSADKFYLPILAANVLVFALWRIPALGPRLTKLFTANAFGPAPCRSMLLSTFSHYSFFHIFANMYVLHSFSNGICHALGKEQTLFVYVTAGLCASYASYIHKVFLGVSGASLGASGAVLGVLGYVCSKYPETQLQIMFLPMLNFAAGDAIIGILALDMLGILCGWKMLDHAAHLGGALFGILWHRFGEEHIWQHRGRITEKIHAFRNWLDSK